MGEPAPEVDNPQLMTQGIGFPLRPVDSVPPQDSGDATTGVVAEGLFLQWVGGYQEGKYYAKGSVTLIDGFTMVANKLTLEYPGPVNDGPEEWTLPDAWTPTTADQDAVVQSGNIWTFNQDGYLTGARVWVPATGPDISYKVLIIDRTDPDNPFTLTIADPNVTAGQWSLVKSAHAIIQAGSVIEVLLEALNSGGTTVVTGGWNYQGINNTAAPPLQGWNRDQQHTLVRFDKTDLDGTDRTSELLGVTPTSTLTVVDTSNATKSFVYSIISTTDSGTFVQYAVNLVGEGNEGPATGTTTATFDVPIPLATEYSREAGGAPTPSWATVEGTLYFDAVPQAVPSDAHGTDLQFQPATISGDWDIMAVDT